MRGDPISTLLEARVHAPLADSLVHHTEAVQHLAHVGFERSDIVRVCTRQRLPSVREILLSEVNVAPVEYVRPVCFAVACGEDTRHHERVIALHVDSIHELGDWRACDGALAGDAAASCASSNNRVSAVPEVTRHVG